jgi:ribosomal protein L40E
MIVIVWKFGVTINPIIQNQYPKFAELPTIVMNAIYLICLGIAYGAYKYLLISFLYTFTWIYEIAFLLVGLYLVFMLATLLMKSSDKLSEIVLHDVKQASGGKKVCKKCGTENPISNKFCDKCGSRLD